MIKDDTRPVACPGGIGTVVDVLLLTTTAADEAHHDIIAVIPQRVISQGDARGRRGLAENSGVGTDTDIALQGNNTTDIEDHNLLITATDGLAEGSVTRVIKIRNMDDFSITSTRNVTSVTFGTREGGSLCLGRHCQGHDSHC